jgi:hypothetical protein
MMMSSTLRSSALFGRGPHRIVLTSNGKARFADALMRLAVASTSWVMAALDAIQPRSSRTATVTMSKNPRIMSF